MSMLLALISTQGLGDQVLGCLDADSKNQLKLVCRSLREEVNRRVTTASLTTFRPSADEWLQLLLCLPKLPTLTSVRFRLQHMTSEAAEALALASADSVMRCTRSRTILVPGVQQPLCQRLRRLELEGVAWGSAQLSAVFSVPWPALEGMTISKSYPKDSVLVASLLAAAVLPRLQRLALSGCHLHPQAVLELAKGNWPQLEELDLSYNNWQNIPAPSPNPVDDQVAAVTALATSSFGRHLRSLNVTNVNMCSAAVAALVQGQWPCLKTLLLNNNTFLDQGRTALCQPGSLHALRRIKLNTSDVTLQLAAALAARTGLTCLCLRDDTPDIIAEGIHWPSLQALDLMSFKLHQSYALHPARFPNVTHLTLRCSCISLLSAGWGVVGRQWPAQLQQLHIKGIFLEARMFEALDIKWPVLRVVTGEFHVPPVEEAMVRTAWQAFLGQCPSLQEHNFKLSLL